MALPGEVEVPQKAVSSFEFYVNPEDKKPNKAKIYFETEEELRQKINIIKSAHLMVIN